MKKFAIIPFLSASVAAIALAVVDPTPPGPPQPPCCKEGLPPAKFSEKSIYSLDETWTADVGREVKLDALRGRPQVMAMFFTSCEYSCPLIVKDMKDIQRSLPAGVREKVDFLLVSIDPARDTPEALRAYRAKHDLGVQHWSLLRGEPKSVKALAEMLGFRYAPGTNLQYAHSLLITILNQSGEIVFQEAGVGNSQEGAVAVLQRLVGAASKEKR